MCISAAAIRAADAERAGGEGIRALHAGFRALLRHESNPFDPIVFNISHRLQKEKHVKTTEWLRSVHKKFNIHNCYRYPMMLY
jgi:hypothetical protein